MATESGGEPPEADWLSETEPVAPPPRRRRSDTLARILWALPWIVFAIAIVAVGDLFFAAAMVLFACAGMNEYFLMAKRARPLAPVAYVAAAAIILVAHYEDQYEILMLLLAALPALFIAALLRERRRNIAYSIAVTMFGLVWIALPFAYAVLLRDLPLHGGALLIDVLVATFVADTAAYAGGRLFGRHQLAPAISPNKTVEGLAFGFVGGMLAFWFAGLYQDWLPGLDALAMGAVIAALAPLGDLFESLLKRDLDVKDSGNLFGPHGGVLDRLDGVLFTVVAGYYLSVAFVY
ncbi:MAG TPA: phosphatidate cytidylyltransferase [Solirubrobacterales bacterium]